MNNNYLGNFFYKNKTCQLILSSQKMLNYPYSFQLLSEKSQLAESNKQLKSQIEQLEKELNNNKINFTTLQKQAQDAQMAKGSNEQQLLR